jgi:glycine dehydrogenase subunit 2
MSAPIREYHAPVWDEPLIMEMGAAARRGAVPPAPIDPSVSADIPAALRRDQPPGLPELSEPEVLRHYLHLSQETMGMVGISLFGTCTMKYNPRVNERLAALPRVADVHPRQHDDTVQGLLQIIHRMDLALRELSGMDRFVFQPGGGAGASWDSAAR